MPQPPTRGSPGHGAVSEVLPRPRQGLASRPQTFYDGRPERRTDDRPHAGSIGDGTNGLGGI
jgi:hypothetical protein